MLLLRTAHIFILACFHARLLEPQLLPLALPLRLDVCTMGPEIMSNLVCTGFEL